MLDQSDKQVLNEGVQMLLNRMDSHPDEFGGELFTNKEPTFIKRRTRWDWVMDGVVQRIKMQTDNHPSAGCVLPFLTDLEVQLIFDKYTHVNRNMFKHAIMQELLSCDEQAEQAWVSSERLRVDAGGNVTLGAGSTVSSTPPWR